MFTAPSYGDRTLNEVQRCVNLYPEKTPEGWKLVSAPGLLLLGAVGNNLPCRGAYLTTTGRIFSAHDNDLYEVSASFPATDRGDFSTTTGDVKFCDNGLQMLIVDGTDGYVYDLVGNTLTTISDVNFPADPLWCTFQDGYFIVVTAGSDTWYVSALNDAADWTPSTFATAESSGDNLLACISTGQELHLIGLRTVEVWYNTGNPSFPFERINGAIHKLGCVDTTTIGVDKKTIYMVAIGDGAGPGVYAISGGESRKVSTPYIDALIRSQAYTFGMVYEVDGHTCYALRRNTSTVVYDITMGTWYERDSNIGGSYLPFRVGHMVHDSAGIPFAFDTENGSVYHVFITTNSENGTAIRRLRAFGPIQAGATRMFHHSIRFVLEVDHDTTASYTLSADLDWTDDGGLTWSTARTLSKAITSGTTGQRVMLEAHRLGSSRQRYYRLTFTGPAARLVLQSAELDMDVGRN